MSVITEIQDVFNDEVRRFEKSFRDLGAARAVYQGLIEGSFRAECICIMGCGNCVMHGDWSSALHKFINYHFRFMKYTGQLSQNLIEEQTKLQSMRDSSDLQKNITQLISSMKDYVSKSEKERNNAVITLQKFHEHLKTSKTLYRALKKVSEPTKRFEISKELYLAQLKQLDGDSVMCAFMDHPTKGTIQIYP